MNSLITFNKVSFSHLASAGEGEVEEITIFNNLTFALPSGVVALVGPNGVGKSTFMLLAAGRLNPDVGEVILLGKDTKVTEDEELNHLCSVIYQNTEFDDDRPVAELLNFVHSIGHQKNNTKLLTEVIKVCELELLQNRRLNTLSKGEQQRVNLAFCLLYGSPINMLDEAFFALESYQKEAILVYIGEYSLKYDKTFYLCLHEIDLCRKHATKAILFNPNGDNLQLIQGETNEVLSDKNLEEAYNTPMATLYQRENLSRERLLLYNTVTQ
ncbi:MAG: ABC transporter ATP-binding protein [Spirochaetaceae bacterium]|nr:ABC transporter ATP-binding protein [Spirochaetaceae bacterium]